MPCPVPWLPGASTFTCSSVAVELRLYIDANACRWFSLLRVSPGTCLGVDMIENSEEGCCEDTTLSISEVDTPGCENSDSEGVASLDGGISYSDMGSSGAGVSSLVSGELPMNLPTNRQRVLSSSIKASVRISWGTLVARLAAGTLIAELSEEDGGRYVPKRSSNARRWAVSLAPANGVVLSWGYRGLAANIYRHCQGESY